MIANIRQIQNCRWLGLCLLAMAGLALQAAPGRPNIVVILADDMGWSDIGCMGGEIATPHLDSLAGEGLRFTQFYNAGRCCPTRASLLTGLYSHRAGVGHMVEDRGRDGYRGDLNNRCVTIAEALRPAGYRNYLAGKWHVTGHVGADGPKDNWPLQRGFDRYYGTIRGAGSYFDPSTLTRDNSAISAFADPEYRPTNYYYTDAITDHATRFIHEHRQSAPGTPFFLYVAYTAPHWPLHALPADLERQRGNYDAGYEPIIAARLAKQKALGLIDVNWPTAPAVGDWEALKTKRWESAGMEVYAAQIARMDQGIGRIIEQLRRAGQLDNTLLLFLSDNGGCAEPHGRQANAQHPDTRPAHPGLPPMSPGALQPPVSTPRQTRAGFPVLMGMKELPGPVDTHMSYGKPWAHVSNTPFREYKSRMHEGGIATPLVVHWPLGIPAERRGKLETQPGHVVDLLATCLDVAGADYPAERNGTKLHPLAGLSLRPALAGKPVQRREPLFWEHEGNRAVRDGRWKLVALGPAGGWELYDLEADRAETRNLAAQQPELAARLAAQWEAWAKSQNVLPWIWKPAYSSSLSPATNAPSTTRAQIEAGSRAEARRMDLRFQPDPALPNVLLLGDSISIGYTPRVRELLKGKANVFRPLKSDGTAENCADTATGLAELDRWLALAPKWDVIHFNWGLHDLKRMRAGQPSSDPADPRLLEVDAYRANFEQLVLRLKQTGARLVFATTTPVPVGQTNPFRSPEDPPRYNAAAVVVAQANGVRVNDLFAFAQARLDKIQLPKNVHFTAAGSEHLAGQVVEAVSAELARKP